MDLMNLPDDKIYEICESLDDKSLLNFSMSNQKVNHICKEILRKRKEMFTISLLNFLAPFYDKYDHSSGYIHRKLNKFNNNLIENLIKFVPEEKEILMKEISDKSLEASKIYDLSIFPQTVVVGIALKIYQLMHQVLYFSPFYWLVHYIPDDYIKDNIEEFQEDIIDVSKIPEYIDEKLICTSDRPVDMFKKAYTFADEGEIISGFHPIGKIQGIPALEVYIDIE